MNFFLITLVVFLISTAGWALFIPDTRDSIFSRAISKNVSNMIYGIFIIALLIREPGGFAALWANTKQKLRMWPYPH